MYMYIAIFTILGMLMALSGYGTAAQVPIATNYLYINNICMNVILLMNKLMYILLSISSCCYKI